MKKIIAFLAIIVTATIGMAQSLPTDAVQFIGTFFPDHQIQNVAQNSSSPELTYRAELDSDITIWFDNNGAWKMVESSGSDISQLLSAKQKESIEGQGLNPSNVLNIKKKEDRTVLVVFNDGYACLLDVAGNFLRKVNL